MCQQTDNEHADEYVAVLFARNLAEAEYYKTLIEEHEIPLRIAQEPAKKSKREAPQGFALMVPEQFFTEAQDIIEQIPSSEEDSDENLDDYLDDELDDDLDGFSQVDSEGNVFFDEDEAEDII